MAKLKTGTKAKLIEGLQEKVAYWKSKQCWEDVNGLITEEIQEKICSDIEALIKKATKTPNQKLIDIIDASGMTTKDVATKAAITYHHLIRLRGDKTIKNRSTTISRLESVLGKKVRKAFE